MATENISKEELKSMIREIIREIELSRNKSKRSNISLRHYSNPERYTSSVPRNSNLENLIGSIPFILFDKTIFQKNMDVVEFAEKIDIHIVGGEKKKLSEIVGRIIEAIKEFPPSKIVQLNQAIMQLKQIPSNKKDKLSFFKDWDYVIKNMKL